jgi:hypothetical protein
MVPLCLKGNVIKLSIRALILEETLLKKGLPLKLITLCLKGGKMGYLGT